MEHFRLKKRLIVAAGLLLLYTVACKSKFEESSPNQVSQFGISLQERMEQKTRIDVRINEVQDALGKLKTIVKLIKQIEKPRAGANVYTPIDFLLDINNELKKNIPENNPDRSIRYTDYLLKFDALSDNCKRVRVSMITESMLDESGAFIGEKTTYAARTCSTEGKFLNFTELQWIGNTRMKMKIYNDNLVKAFSGIFYAEPLTVPHCDIERNANSVVKAECTDFTVFLSVSESAKFDYLRYDAKADLTLSTLAHIYENTDLKADTVIEVYKNGRVHLQVTKPNQPATASITQLESKEELRALTDVESTESPGDEVKTGAEKASPLPEASHE